MFTAIRNQEICFGHRVYQDKLKCSNLHGHSCIFEFHCEARTLIDLQNLIDGSLIKNNICRWLLNNWDHKLLLWEDDPLALRIFELDTSVQIVTFNPTPENMANYLLNMIAPVQFNKNEIICFKVNVHGFSKCEASRGLSY